MTSIELMDTSNKMLEFGEIEEEINYEPSRHLFTTIFHDESISSDTAHKILDIYMIIQKEIKNSTNQQNISNLIGKIEFHSDYILDFVGMAYQKYFITEENYYKIDHNEVLGAGFDQISQASKNIRKCYSCGDTQHCYQQCPKRDFINKNCYQNDNENKRSYSVRYSDRTNPGRPHLNSVPGSLQPETYDALGIDPNILPPYIYMMRKYGYPPGYKVRRRNQSNISVAGEEIINENEFQPKEDKDYCDKTIVYPGFNAPVPEGIIDEACIYDFPPIDPSIFVEIPPSVQYMFELEEVIRLNSAPKEGHVRGYFLEPLSLNVFPPHRKWRCTPILMETPNLDTLSSENIVKVNRNDDPYGEEQLPTNRLENILQYLKFHKPISEKLL